MHMRNREHQVCQVSEALVLSSLLRYENILLATDILPDVLSASVNRNSVSATGRHPGSAAFAYVRYFLKKYRDVASVARWEKNFRTTCDQRLLAELDNGVAYTCYGCLAAHISQRDVKEGAWTPDHSL